MTKNEMHALAIGVKAFSDIRQELMGGLDYRKLHGMAKIALVEVTAILVHSSWHKHQILRRLK